MAALSCNETCTLPGLGSCPEEWRPPPPNRNLWTRRPGISQHLLDISISRAASDSLWSKDGLGNTQMSHNPLQKELSHGAHSVWQANVHVLQSDLQLLCLLLLTTTLTAGKINVHVSPSPCLVWKPETNIETLKSPNVSFPINYQWLHLACWAAVISGQVISEQPAFSLGPELHTTSACVHSEAAISQQYSSFPSITNAIHLPVTQHTDTHEAGESEKAE